MIYELKKYINKNLQKLCLYLKNQKIEKLKILKY